MLAYLVYPKFPEDTRSLVSRELEAVSKITDPVVAYYDAKFLEKRAPVRYSQYKNANPGSLVVCDKLIIPNPLPMFYGGFKPENKFAAKTVYIVLHDHSYTVSGLRKYDLDRLPDILSDFIIYDKLLLCPVSSMSRTLNKSKIEALDIDWHNICDLPSQEYTIDLEDICDYRGRHSQNKIELFPAKTKLLEQFPRNKKGLIIGGEHLKSLYRNSSVRVTNFIPDMDKDKLDFNYYVYDHSIMFRETFGRNVAEALMKNILVFAPAYLKSVFSNVLDVSDVGLIDTLCKNPDMYEDTLRRQQEDLRPYSQENFINRVGELLVQ